MVSWEYGERQEVSEETLGGGEEREDVLEAFQVPVLSLAASQHNDCYQKAGILMPADGDDAV